MAGRTILLNLVGRDQVSRVMRNVSREMAQASDESSRLARAMGGLEKVGRAGGLATAAAGALALSRAAAPAAAAVAALPAAMAAAKVATGTLKVGLVGVGDAMSALAEGDTEALNESLKKLAPTARAFVKQAAAMRDQVVGLQQAVQNRLFAGLDRDLSRLGRNLLPTARDGMVGVAGALNGIAREAVKTAATPWFRGQVDRVFAGTTGVVETLQGAVRPLLETVLRLTVAGMPLVNQLAAWAVQGVRVLASWIRVKVETGALQGVITGIIGSLRSLGVSGANLIRTLVNITGQTRAMGDAGGSFLTTLDQLTAKMAAWSASAQGQQTAANLFRTLGQSVQQLGVALPILLSPLALIVKAIASLPAPLQSVVGKTIAWSLIIGVVANRLKVLTAITLAHTAATKGATGAIAAYRAVAGASALGGLIAGFRNVNLAMAANATTATRLGAALRSQILLWRQQAAATGVSTARIIANAAAQKIAAAATRVWAIAQAIFNAVMSANPIALVILAVVALGAALVLAYKKSETFRNIVNAAWAGIKAAVVQAWTFIKPVFDIYKWYVMTVLVGALKLYWAYVKFVFTTVWTIIQTTWNFIKPIFMAIVAVVVGVLSRAWIVLQNIIKIVWIAIQIYIKVAWFAIKGYFNLIKLYVTKVLVPIFLFLYNNVVKPVFNGIVTVIRLAWAGMKVVFNAVRTFLAKTLGPQFTVFKKVGGDAWSGLRSVISTVWNSGIKPAFNAVKSALKDVQRGFSVAVSAIKKIWGGLKSATKEPVNFVIGLYNDGIVSLVNKVAGFAGVKTRLSKIPKFATGGVLPGYSPGVDSLIAAVSPGEAIMRPEFTRAVGAGFVHRANDVARRSGVEGVRKWLTGPDAIGGEGLAFARGGVVPGFAGQYAFGGIIGKFVKGVKDFTIGNVEKAAGNLLGKILKPVPGVGIFRDVINAIPAWIKDHILKWIKSKVASGGPGAKKALAFARAQEGKPYVWGGVGPGGYDCSGFMSALTNVIQGKNPYSRRFTTFSFTGARGGPASFVNGLRSAFTVGVTNAGVGHMAGTLLGHNVESSGSAGVRVDGGARGTSNGMFPMKYGLKFDEGGMLPRGWSAVYNGLRQPEPVFPSREAAAAYGGRGDGPLVTIERVEVTEGADVDMLAGRLGFAIRAAAF